MPFSAGSKRKGCSRCAVSEAGPGRRGIAALKQLAWRERILLLQAAVLLVALRALLRSAGVRRAHGMLDRWARPAAFGNRRAWSSPRDVQSAVHLVAMAARRLPVSTTCLHRSLALWWLLRRRGVDCQLRLGARRTAERLDAHAWVEYQGRVVNDDPQKVGEYVPLSWHPAGQRP